MKKWILLGLVCACLLSACSSDDGGSSNAGQNRDGGPTAAVALSKEEREQLKQDFATTPFKVLHVSELSFDNAPAIAVAFSSPIDPKSNWRDYLSIAKVEGDAPKGDWILGDTLNTVYFPFIEAETAYTVKVESGLEALTGRSLSSPLSQQLSTRAKEQNVKFISHGTQLSPKLSDGLSVEAVNVEAIDMDFFRIRPSSLTEFLANGIGNYLYELENIKSYGDLVHSARFDLEFAPNKRIKSVVPVTEIEALKKPGVYFAVMREAGKYAYEYQTTWFSIGDVGFQVRSIGQQYIAFTHEVDSAKPSSGVTIRLFDENAKALAEEKTDGDGFAKLAGLAKDPYFAIAEKGEHLSILKLRNAAMDLSEFSLPSRLQKSLELFIYSARDLYRPGELVQLNALLRDQDAKLASAPPIQATVLTPDGRSFQSFNWQGDKQAFYEFAFNLPKQAMRGEWELRAVLGNGDTFNYAFSVEDFLPERMKLQLESTAGKHLSINEIVQIDLQGDYLYGAPASGNRVEASVKSTQARTLFDEFKEFIFGVEDYRDYDLDIALDSIELNDTGHAQLTLPQEWQGAANPIRLNTQVSLFESGGRPVTRSLVQFLWPRDNAIGLRPTWKGERANPNSQALLELIQVNKSGEQTEAKNLDILVYREDQQYYWEWSNDWQYSNNREDVPVYNRILDIPANERAAIAVPVEYGHYRVEVRDRTQNLLASYRFFAGWSWDRPESGETGRPDKVKLAWNADSLNAGDAELTVDSPYDGTALITVEAGELLWHKQKKVKAGENTFDIPVDASWNRHDIYTTVNVVRAGVAKRKQLPKRAFGLIHLPLKRDDRLLTVNFDVPEKVLPDTELHTKINIEGAAGETVNLTLAAVDSGVLSVSKFKTPEAHSWFFEARAYNSEVRDTWASFIEQLSDTRARQRFGGDADDELARGGEAPQSEIQIVSLFSGKVEVDAMGQAHVAFDLPYFNGELRLMALAWSDNKFGHQETKVKVAAPLIAEVSTPRFLARGDQSNASFDLQNLTDATQALSVKASTSSALGGDTVDLNISLEPQQRHIFQLPLNATQSSGTGEVNIEVRQSDKIENPVNLERSWKVGLRPAYPAELKQTDYVINANETFTAPRYNSVPFELSSQQMQLSVSPQPPLNLNEHLQGLLQYPYGCLEQTTSRAWPLLVSSDAELKQYASDTQKDLVREKPKALALAIGRISGMQRPDGSFGLWSNQANENHWLSVYATEFLLEAKAQGYAVDDQTLAMALERLAFYVDTQGRIWTEYDHYSESPDHYHFSYRAYAALVLARNQKVNLGQVRSLYDALAKDAVTQLPLAQIALALELVGDARRSEAAWAKAFAQSRENRIYTGDYASQVRDLAWISSLAKESKIVKRPFQKLMDLRNALIANRWLSTQDRWALFHLGHILEAQSVPEWSLSMTANGSDVFKPYEKAATEFWQGTSVPTDLSIKNVNQYPLFLSMQYSGYPTSAPKAQEEGIRVRRFFYNEKGQAIDLRRVKTGDLVLVRLDVSSISEEQIPDALVVDLLPAGLELENQNLDSAVKIDDMRVQNQTVEQWLYSTNIVHQEYQDDRYVAAIKLNRNASSLFYLARAVTPGTYNIPPSLVEDMYRPWMRAVSKSEGQLVVLPK